MRVIKLSNYWITFEGLPLEYNLDNSHFYNKLLNKNDIADGKYNQLDESKKIN